MSTPLTSVSPQYRTGSSTSIIAYVGPKCGILQTETPDTTFDGEVDGTFCFVFFVRNERYIISQQESCLFNSFLLLLVGLT